MKSLLLLVLFATAILTVTTVANCTKIQPANGTTLSLEAPPPPSLFMNGSAVNLSEDDKDRDLSIDPTDDLPANGTQTLSTVGATDMDINEFPPMGVSVLIQNQSVTVTNHTVSLGNGNVGGSDSGSDDNSDGDSSSDSSDEDDE